MNFLRLILALYFVALSVMPCEDVHKQLSSSKSDFALSVEESHSKDQGDICSPLCVCNCCQITVAAFKMEPQISIPRQELAYFSKKILFHKNNFAYQVYENIWQPPKI